jgi:hypothetical protein
MTLRFWLTFIRFSNTVYKYLYFYLFLVYLTKGWKGVKRMMKWKYFEGSGCCLSLRYYPGIRVEGLRIPGLLAEI